MEGPICTNALRDCVAYDPNIVKSGCASFGSAGMTADHFLDGAHPNVECNTLKSGPVIDTLHVVSRLNVCVARNPNTMKSGRGSLGEARMELESSIDGLAGDSYCEKFLDGAQSNEECRVRNQGQINTHSPIVDQRVVGAMIIDRIRPLPSVDGGKFRPNGFINSQMQDPISFYGMIPDASHAQLEGLQPSNTEASNSKGYRWQS
ncbi:hypothetical protein SESBI_34803 [Sesbania bispinosa]|nr:hypothetical protein SESBI_34803 [Sesbania bispinosa]